jgi:hypothetical protein
MAKRWAPVRRFRPPVNSLSRMPLHSAYGLQPWDRKFLWNIWLVYEPSFYKNQHGLLGHIAGGWSLAPIISVGSGLPLEVQPTDAFANEMYGSGQSFGEGDGGNFAALQNAVLICPNGSSRHNNPVPSKLGLGSNFFGPSMFQNPDYSYSEEVPEFSEACPSGTT